MFINPYNNIITESIVPSRNIGCLWVLWTSVYRLLSTLVHSSFYPLPCLPTFSSRFSVFLSSRFPEGFKVGQPLVSLHPLFLMCETDPSKFLFLISKFISSFPVTFHRSLLDIIFGHKSLGLVYCNFFRMELYDEWHHGASLFSFFVH
jgi:hypothetical protein